MTAGAAHWLETLTTADKQTWAAFKAKFCSRYLQPEYIHFRAAKLLFNTKQQPSESADDFLAKIQQLARQINADEQTTRFAALNGLMPHIASFVTQKQPKTMTELLEAARIAELTAPSTFESDTSVAKIMANVEQQLKLMRAEWEGHTASAAGVAPTPRSGSPKTECTPPHSRSPRNVHWRQNQQFDILVFFRKQMFWSVQFTLLYHIINVINCLIKPVSNWIIHFSIIGHSIWTDTTIIVLLKLRNVVAVYKMLVTWYNVETVLDRHDNHMSLQINYGDSSRDG